MGKRMFSEDIKGILRKPNIKSNEIFQRNLKNLYIEGLEDKIFFFTFNCPFCERVHNVGIKVCTEFRAKCKCGAIVYKNKAYLGFKKYRSMLESQKNEKK